MLVGKSDSCSEQVDLVTFEGFCPQDERNSVTRQWFANRLRRLSISMWPLTLNPDKDCGSYTISAHYLTRRSIWHPEHERPRGQRPISTVRRLHVFARDAGATAMLDSSSLSTRETPLFQPQLSTVEHDMFCIARHCYYMMFPGINTKDV